MLAALATGALASACAGGATLTPYVPAPSGTLEVINRTSEAREVVVQGFREGIVEPGARARFRFLPTGPADVSAFGAGASGDGAHGTTTDGAEASGLDPVPAQRRVTLSAGRIVKWEIPGPLPEPAAFGDLVVTNTLARHVQVSIAGRAVGPVLAGDTRRFRDVSVGVVEVNARDVESGLDLTSAVELAADSEASWVISAPMGQITVVNDSYETVKLTLDGTARGSVGPGQREVLDDVADGDRVLKAHGTLTGVDRTHRVSLSAEAPYTWTLSGDRAAIDVTNGSDEPVELRPTPGADEPQVIKPGETVRLGDLVAGTRLLEAVGVESGLPYGERFDLVPGQQVRWLVRPIHGTLRVDNGTLGALELYLDGAWQTRLEPGAGRTISRLPQGPHEVTAVSPNGRLRFTKEVAAGAARTARWRISSETAPVMVVNKRAEPMAIYVDGRRRGEVDAQATLTMTGIEVGPRLIEAVGIKTRETLPHKVVLATRPDPAAPISRLVLDDPHAQLLLTNSSDESLIGQGVLVAQLAGPLPPGDKRLVRLPVGRMSLRLVGERTGVAYARDLAATNGEVLDWSVAKARGGVEITNHLADTVLVRVDDREVGRMASGTTLSVGDLPAGPHALSAEPIGAGQPRAVERFITPDQFTRWTLDPASGRVIVFNDSDDALLITLNGRPYGQVEPAARKGFDGLIPGDWRLHAIGVRSGWQRSVSFTLREGATESVLVAPPMAVLVIDNGSGEAVSVSIDGADRQAVAAGATEILSVPSGTRHVQVTGDQTGIARWYKLQLGVDQSHQLDLPPALARLAVVNEGDIALTIRLHDLVLGRIEGGASLIVDDLAPGAWRLRAMTEDGVTTHSDRRKVGAGETTTWRLAAVRTPSEPPAAPEASAPAE